MVLWLWIPGRWATTLGIVVVTIAPWFSQVKDPMMFALVAVALCGWCIRWPTCRFGMSGLASEAVAAVGLSFDDGDRWTASLADVAVACSTVAVGEVLAA